MTRAQQTTTIDPTPNTDALVATIIASRQQRDTLQARLYELEHPEHIDDLVAHLEAQEDIPEIRAAMRRAAVTAAKSEAALNAARDKRRADILDTRQPERHALLLKLDATLEAASLAAKAVDDHDAETERLIGTRPFTALGLAAMLLPGSDQALATWRRVMQGEGWL